VTFEVELGGRLPQALIRLMSERFGDVTPNEQQNTTTLHGSVPDQAALRALLCLIWDIGGTVLSVAVFTPAS
jgi:hypothetical protein